MRDIPFVDAHVHLWELSHIHYPWLTPPFGDDGPNGNVEAIATDYPLDAYLAESANWTVAGLVHVEAGAAPVRALDETRWLQASADAGGLPQGIVAFAALDDPQVERLLDAHAAHNAVKGIRHIVNWHADPQRSYTPRDVTGDAAWERGFGLLAKYGLSFDLQAYPGQFATLADLFKRHPDTIVVIDHAGMPVDRDEAGMARWRDGLACLAALPNVAIKLSGFGLTDRRVSTKRIRPLCQTILDLFGSDRLCAASNFPTDRLFAQFDATLDMLAACIADLSKPERRAVWGGNADRIYRLGMSLSDSTSGLSDIACRP